MKRACWSPGAAGAQPAAKKPALEEQKQPAPAPAAAKDTHTASGDATAPAEPESEGATSGAQTASAHAAEPAAGLVLVASVPTVSDVQSADVEPAAELADAPAIGAADGSRAQAARHSAGVVEVDAGATSGSAAHANGAAAAVDLRQPKGGRQSKGASTKGKKGGREQSAKRMQAGGIQSFFVPKSKQ